MDLLYICLIMLYHTEKQLALNFMIHEQNGRVLLYCSF